MSHIERWLRRFERWLDRNDRRLTRVGVVFLSVVISYLTASVALRPVL